MDLLSSTLNGIGQVGEAVDKFTGGRAVRGTLAGKPRELLSVLPFSDSMGLTDHNDMTSGRDITDHYGITDKNDKGWGSSAAGFVADNVLSPANWLGAGAAFKAAPTVARGLGGAAKALTGADLLDHIAGGAKKLGGFLGGEAGVAKIPPPHYAAPLPVDVPTMNAQAQATNASRPRRWSADSSKKEWYAGDRQARFGRHFGGGPGNTSVPGGIPEFSLNDAIKNFAADESGSLHLPYDHMKLPPRGMPRSAPEWVNNRTFYSGGATKGLSGPDLDPLKTLPGNLFGRGIYTTDNNSIAKLYAENAVSGKLNPDDYREELERFYRDLVADEGPDVEYPGLDHLAEERPHLFPRPVVYQGKSNFGKILDLDEPPQGRLIEATRSLVGRHKGGLQAPVTSGALIEDIARRGLNAGTRESKDPLIAALRGEGYDALTHTGGIRTGGIPHQVVIGLDPNDKLGLGRKTPYSIWEAMKNFGADESGYLRHAIPGVEPELANAMDGLGPMYPGGAEKLREIARVEAAKTASSTPHSGSGGEPPWHSLRIMDIANDAQHAERLAGEIPEGSQYLGSGIEGVAFRAPDGSVIRVGDAPGQAVRPDLPEMLQAFREAKVGPYKVEHMPQVSPVYESFERPLKEAGSKIMGMEDAARASDASLDAHDAIGANNQMNLLHEEMTNGMRSSLDRRGYDPWDVSAWNTGITPEGKGIIYDGGSIRANFNPSKNPDVNIDAFKAKPTYEAPSGDLLRRVMDAGGPEKVRESLRLGIAEGSRGQGVDMPQLADLIARRQEVQRFLAGHGVDAGMPIGGNPASAMAPQYAGAGQGAPSLGMLLGTLGATAGGGGLLSYLMGGGNNDGYPR